MKSLLLALAFFLAYVSLVFANTDRQQQLKNEIGKLEAAMRNGNYESVVKTLHPEIVKVMGGEAQALKALKQGYDALKTEGYDLAGTRILQSKAIQTAGAYDYAQLAYKMPFHHERGDGHYFSNLFAFSKKEASVWYFMDLNDASNALLRSLEPALGQAATPRPMIGAIKSRVNGQMFYVDATNKRLTDQKTFDSTYPEGKQGEVPSRATTKQNSTSPNESCSSGCMKLAAKVGIGTLCVTKVAELRQECAPCCTWIKVAPE